MRAVAGMMRNMSVVVLSGVFLMPVSASAHWRYTHWGMSPSAVEIASKHSAAPASQSESDGYSSKDGRYLVKLAAPYSSGEFQFTAYFGFNQNDRLSGVTLRLTGGNPYAVIGALRGKYGKPTQEDDSPSSTMNSWMWRSGGDQISAIMIGGDYLTVNYGPGHTASENGL